MEKAFVPPEVLTMIEMETFLSKNIYLSGTENPGQIDSKMIDHLNVRVIRLFLIELNIRIVFHGTGLCLFFLKKLELYGIH
jgi:hypothetical protein